MLATNCSILLGNKDPHPPYILKKHLYGSGRFTRSVLARQNPRHFADPLKILIPDKHDIILHFQHGFQSGLSCESQLIETVHDWMTALDNKTQIDAILLDFAKAFDKVPHKRLLSKLTSYGITGNTHNWITSFLSNHKAAGLG